MAYHKIKAWLHDNPLSEKPTDLIARTASERTLNIRDICHSAATRGGADISEDAMEHAVNLWLKEMSYNLCDGFSINTGWFSAAVRIRGTFESPLEHFDPARHRLSFEFQQGSLMRKEVATTDVEILGVADHTFHIAQVTDIMTGSINNRLTPGRNLHITGSRIKLAGESPNLGVYFIVSGTQTATRVPDYDVVINKPSELMVIIPELAAGTYQLAITTQYSGSSLLKDPRQVIFDPILTVS